MKSIRIKRMVGVLLLLITLILSIKSVGWFLCRKESYKRYSSFFSEKNNVDVIFLGTSHFQYGIFPMELWENYGISSYNLAGEGSTIPASYWVLVNSLDYNEPKIVVMDTYDIWPRNMYSIHWGQVHDQFDAFPMSLNKFRMIEDLCDSRRPGNIQDVSQDSRRYELLFDLYAYHTRWSDLSEDDYLSRREIDEISRIWKGASPQSGVVSRDKKTYSTYNPYKPDELATEYLQMIIQLCKDNDIELVLVNTGYDCDEESKAFHDSAERIAHANRLKYVDLTAQEQLIDFKTDLYSTGPNTHLNYSGAMKLTNYLGDLLNCNYTLEDHRNDSKFYKWNEDYQKYKESKHEYLKEQKDLPTYFTFLYNTDYSVIIEVRNKDFYSEQTYNLLNNLGICANNETNLICTNLKENSANTMHIDYSEPFDIKTVVGNLNYSANSAKGYSLSLNGDVLYNISSNEGDSWVRIITISNSSDEIVDIRVFGKDDIIPHIE